MDVLPLARKICEIANYRCLVLLSFSIGSTLGVKYDMILALSNERVLRLAVWVVDDRLAFYQGTSLAD